MSYPEKSNYDQDCARQAAGNALRGGQATIPSPPSAEIPPLVSEIHHRINSLHDRASILESRLALVCRSPSPKASNDSEKSQGTRTDLGNQLQSVCVGLNHLESRIVDMLDRLEL